MTPYFLSSSISVSKFLPVSPARGSHGWALLPEAHSSPIPSDHVWLGFPQSSGCGFSKALLLRRGSWLPRPFPPSLASLVDHEPIQGLPLPSPAQAWLLSSRPDNKSNRGPHHTQPTGLSPFSSWPLPQLTSPPLLSTHKCSAQTFPHLSPATTTCPQILVSHLTRTSQIHPSSQTPTQTLAPLL